jgi:rhamnosyltransferase
MLASIIIPTRNEESNIGLCLERVYSQRVSFPFEVIVIDSGSRDRTLKIVEHYPARVMQIAPSEFHHARTRNLGAAASSGQYLVFLSGDAIPADNEWLGSLVRNFDDGNIAAVYGRQLPKVDAKPERVFFMQHRYGNRRLVKRASVDAAGKYRLYQFSNVNSAIRKDVWQRFPFAADLNAYEDFSFAIQVVQQGFSIAYEPEAAVFHSHNYSLVRSFQQYFDSGVLYRRRRLWDARHTSQLTSDGVLYVWNEIQFLLRHRAAHRVPYALFYEAARYLGLVLGRNEHLLPNVVKRGASSHRLFG